MAIVIEDGTGVETANSYASVAETQAYAAAHGVTLADAAAVEQMLLDAALYLESLKYKGERTHAVQALSWPRSDVEHDGRTFASDAVPTAIVRAQMQLVLELHAGILLWESASAVASGKKFVKRKKVDVLETEYATPAEMGAEGGAAAASIPKVDAMLAPFRRSRQPLYTYRA